MKIKNKIKLTGKDIFFEIMIKRKSGKHELPKKYKHKKDRQKIKKELRKYSFNY